MSDEDRNASGSWLVDDENDEAAPEGDYGLFDHTP